jgi:hypothetical protein
MASPNASLAQLYAWDAAKMLAPAGRLTAAAAAQNNSLVAAAKNNSLAAKGPAGLLMDAALLSIAAAAKSNSMSAAAKNPLNALMATIEKKQGRMWIVEDFEKLMDDPVGSGQCPGIVQSFGGCPLVEFWFEGPKVRGNHAIPYGTVVATFVDGKYPNWDHGNHVAIYITQDATKGVLVFDQWKGQPAQYRWMKFKDNAGVIDRSDNGSALSIVLTRKTN